MSSKVLNKRCICKMIGEIPITLTIIGEMCSFTICSLNMKCPILKPYNYIFLWVTERWWELLRKDTNLLQVWKKFPVTFLGIKKKKKSALTLWASKWLLWNSSITILKTNPQKDLWSFPRRPVIHFPCCHDVSKHDKWLCMMKYGYQTTLLHNSHLSLLLIKFMYADMTVSPKRSMTVRNIAIFETKNILVSKLRIWRGTAAGKERKWHCA